jgi:hypothetical protein
MDILLLYSFHYFILIGAREGGPLTVVTCPFVRRAGPSSEPGVLSVMLIQWNLDREPVVSFPDDHFDVARMLVVFEHIEKPRLVPAVTEIRRVLPPRWHLRSHEPRLVDRSDPVNSESPAAT